MYKILNVFCKSEDSLIVLQKDPKGLINALEYKAPKGSELDLSEIVNTIKENWDNNSELHGFLFQNLGLEMVKNSKAK